MKNYRAAGCVGRAALQGTRGVTTSAEPLGVVLNDEQRFVRCTLWVNIPLFSCHALTLTVVI